ncbi:MAG: hypothetical protein ACR2FI_06710 [Burkholderiales bacterium]
MKRNFWVWSLLMLLAILISSLAFRGYMNPALLINFANAFYC